MRDVRVIIDADTACEGDDPFAIVHALLSAELDIRGICSEHYISYTLLGGVSPRSEEKSFQQNKRFLKLMGRDDVPVLHGARTALKDTVHFIENEASRFIVSEAHRADERRLFIVAQGAVTNIASAYLMDPSIGGKITLIMISGGPYPKGSAEYNCIGDLYAVNILMDSDMEIWQVPSDVYGTMCVSFQELLENVWRHGEIGKKLTENLEQVNKRMCGSFLRNSALGVMLGMQYRYPSGSAWRLGDSPVVGLLLNENLGTYTLEEAPGFQIVPGRKLQSGQYISRSGASHPIRVYHAIDSRWILNDFYQKIAEYASAGASQKPPRHICPRSKKLNLILESACGEEILNTVRWALDEDKIARVLVVSDADIPLPGNVQHVGKGEAAGALLELVRHSGIPSAYFSDGEFSALCAAAKNGSPRLWKKTQKKTAIYYCGDVLTEGLALALRSDMRTYLLPEEKALEYGGRKHRLLTLSALLLDNHEFASQQLQEYSGIPCGKNTILVNRMIRGLVPARYFLSDSAQQSDKERGEKSYDAS